MTDWDSIAKGSGAGKTGATDWGAIAKGSTEATGKGPGIVRGIADSALSVAGGAVGATKALTDVFGAQNAISGALGNVHEGIRDLESDYSKAQRKSHAERMKAAEGTGSIWEEVKAAGQNFAERPLDYSLEGLGSLATFAPLRLIGAGATGAEAIAAANKARTTAATVMGMGQGVGAVKGSQYDAVLQRAKEAGLSDAEAEQQAQQAQAYTRDNAGNLALGAGLGALAARTGAENILLGQPAKTGEGVLKRTIRGIAAETPMEAAQGGQERLAANIASQGAGYDVDTWQGVAGQAATVGLMSAGPGGIAGALSRPAVQGENAPATLPPNSPGDTTPALPAPTSVIPPTQYAQDEEAMRAAQAHADQVYGARDAFDLARDARNMEVDYADVQDIDVSAAEQPVYGVDEAEEITIRPPYAARQGIARQQFLRNETPQSFMGWAQDMDVLGFIQSMPVEAQRRASMIYDLVGNEKNDPRMREMAAKRLWDLGQSLKVQTPETLPADAGPMAKATAAGTESGAIQTNAYGFPWTADMAQPGAPISVGERANFSNMAKGAANGLQEQRQETAQEVVPYTGGGNIGMTVEVGGVQYPVAASGQPALSLGKTPNSAEPVTVKEDGTIYIGKYPAQDYETGENVTTQDASITGVKAALNKAQAIPNGFRLYGGPMAKLSGLNRKPNAPKQAPATGKPAADEQDTVPATPVPTPSEGVTDAGSAVELRAKQREASQDKPKPVAEAGFAQRTLNDLRAENGTKGVWLGDLNKDGDIFPIKITHKPTNRGDWWFDFYDNGKVLQSIPFPRITGANTAQQVINDLLDYVRIDSDNTWSFDNIGAKHAELLGKKEASATRAKDAEISAMRKFRGDTEERQWDAVDMAMKREYDAINAKRYKSTADEKMLGILEQRIKASPQKWQVGDGVGYKVNSGRGAQTNRGFRIASIDYASKQVTIRQVADTGLTSTGGNNDRIAPQVMHVGDIVRDRKYDAPSAQTATSQGEANQPTEAQEVTELHGHAARVAERLATRGRRAQDVIDTIKLHFDKRDARYSKNGSGIAPVLDGDGRWHAPSDGYVFEGDTYLGGQYLPDDSPKHTWIQAKILAESAAADGLVAKIDGAKKSKAFNRNGEDIAFVTFYAPAGLVAELNKKFPTDGIKVLVTTEYATQNNLQHGKAWKFSYKRDSKNWDYDAPELLEPAENLQGKEVAYVYEDTVVRNTGAKEAKPTASQEVKEKASVSTATAEGAAESAGATQREAAASKIDDFGEKILGARKDYAAKLKEAQDVDVAAVPLSKSWPEPNYEKMLADDYIVPETPEFDGNMTGDLAYTPRSAEASGIEQLPIRLTVGVAREAHRGFGIMHMADNATRDSSRKPPQVTDDEAENFARQVTAVARTFQSIHHEHGNRYILISPKSTDALVVERITDSYTGEDFYSAVTLLQAKNRHKWGKPVWAGRADFPVDRTLQSRASTPSSDQEAQQSDRQPQRNQTSHFDFKPVSPDRQPKKQPTITVKKRRAFTVKESRAAVSQSVTAPHTATTLKVALDAEFGKGFADRLEATGRVSFIQSGQLPDAIGEAENTDIKFSQAGVTFRSDVPNESWLGEQVDYAKRTPRDAHGVPYMGKVTGYFRGGNPDVSVDVLAMLKGEKSEQSNIRQQDIDWLVEEMRNNGLKNIGVPYIEVGYDGVPWVSEGNHRIMAAQRLGWESMPVEIRYFDGGERVNGVMRPDKVMADIRFSKDDRILAYVQNGNITFVVDNISQANDDVRGLALHEIGVHAMQMGRSDPEFKKLLGQFEAMRDRNPMVREAFARVPKDTPAHLVTEEALGHMVEAGPRQPIAQRFLAWLRSQVRKLAENIKGLDRARFAKWANDLTEADLIYMATQATRRAPEALGGMRGRQSAMRSGPEYPWYSPLMRAVESAKQGTMPGNQWSRRATVPSVANEVLKKLGGGKVGTIEAEGQHPGFLIQESMRAKVKTEGMPLFSRTLRTDAGNIIENPTRDQAENLLARSRYKSMRGLRDPETGKLYIWDASDAIHHQVAREMGITDDVYERLEFDDVDALPNGVFSGEAGYGRVIADRPGAYEVRFSKRAIIGDSGRQYTPEQAAMHKRVGRDVEQLTAGEKIRKWASQKWAQGIFDQFAPFKEINKKAYTLMRLSKGSSGAFEALIRHGKLSIRDGAYDADTSGGALERVFAPLGKETTDFLYWVAGNRAEKLMQEDREHLFTDADIQAAKSLANGDTDFDYTLKNGNATRNRAEIYKDSLDKFNEFNKNVMDMAEQSGLIDGESRQYWEQEFYVPFYRIDDEADVTGGNIKQGVVRQKAFHKLKGGTDGLNDLLANTLANWAHLIDASVKNRAAKVAIEAAEQMGVARQAVAGEKKTVWFVDGGAKREYVIEDRAAMEALEGLTYAGMSGPMMDALSKTKHWLTIGVTASPFFKVRNLIRDSVQAVAVSPLSYNIGKNLKVGFKLTGRENQEYVSALAGGGLIRFGTMLEGNEASRTRQLIKKLSKDSYILDNENKLRAFYDKWLEPSIAAYNELGNRGEEINRMALYEQLTKHGIDHATASLMARDLMDFSLQGTFKSIRFLAQTVPFFNARLQGLHKLGRAAKDDRARMATVVGATALMSLALLAHYHDDDDWKKREDWDRDNYWWFKFGGTAFRIPKPFEIGAIATLAERSAELLFDKEMTGKRFRDTTLHLLANQLAMNPTPQLVKPIVDVYANKDSFTGRPIETMGMERLDPEYRYTGRTSMLARGVSTSIGGAYSPVQVDHLLRAYFAWLGAFIVGGTDIVLRGVSNEPTRPAVDAFKFSTGGMVAEVDSASSRYVSQMYDQAKELERAYATYRHLLKRGRTEEAKEYMADNVENLRNYRRTERIKSAIARQNQAIRKIEDSDINPDEKRQRIQAIKRLQDQMSRRMAQSSG